MLNEDAPPSPKPRGKQRVISKLPREMPEIESVPWRITTVYGEAKVISLPRVRFLEEKQP